MMTTGIDWFILDPLTRVSSVRMTRITASALNALYPLAYCALLRVAPFHASTTTTNAVSPLGGIDGRQSTSVPQNNVNQEARAYFRDLDRQWAVTTSGL